MNTANLQIIDEQDMARLLANHSEILASHPDEASAIHRDAAAMASEIAGEFQAMIDPDSGGWWPAERHDRLSRLHDYAGQLQAHHLDCLDRLSPV